MGVAADTLRDLTGDKDLVLYATSVLETTATHVIILTGDEYKPSYWAHLGLVDACEPVGEVFQYADPYWNPGFTWDLWMLRVRKLTEMSALNQQGPYVQQAQWLVDVYEFVTYRDLVFLQGKGNSSLYQPLQELADWVTASDANRQLFKIGETDLHMGNFMFDPVEQRIRATDPFNGRFYYAYSGEHLIETGNAEANLRRAWEALHV